MSRKPRENPAYKSFQEAFEAFRRVAQPQREEPEIFWTCDPCKVLTPKPENAPPPERVFCPLCGTPMRYHGPRIIDIEVEDTTPKMLPEGEE